MLQNVLSPDERMRAARFTFDRDQRRFVVAHGVLRHILAGYVGHAPSKLQFGTNPYGKPHLVGSPSLRFNLSHSHDVAMIAIARAEVGIDVEAVRPIDDLLNIAQQFFLADEVEGLRRLPTEAQPPAFYRIWTRKEAYLKAIGTGLNTRLDGVRVGVGEQALGVWEPLELNARFHAQELVVTPPYVCALVADSTGTNGAPIFFRPIDAGVTRD